MNRKSKAISYLYSNRFTFSCFISSFCKGNQFGPIPGLRSTPDIVEDSRNRQVRLYPNIKQILEHLQANDFDIGISSLDRKPELCRRILELHGILHFFKEELIKISGAKKKHFEQFVKYGYDL